MIGTNKRLIQVVSLQGNQVIERQSAALTWGALKEEFPEIENAARGSNAWLKAGKVDLTSDSAPLPNNGEPVVIYLYVDKMKAGRYNSSESGAVYVEDEIGKLSEDEKREARDIIEVVEEDVINDLRELGYV